MPVIKQITSPPWDFWGSTDDEGMKHHVSGLDGEPVGSFYRSQDAQLASAAPQLLAVAAWAEAAFGYLKAKATTQTDRDEFARRLQTTREAIAKANTPTY
jgi:hypothetical protein